MDGGEEKETQNGKKALKELHSRAYSSRHCTVSLKEM